MDQVGVPQPTDVQSQSHRQSILGSFLRVRPRGASQSHQGGPPNLQLDIHDAVPIISNAVASPINGGMMAVQPPSPGLNANSGHRRRPAAGGLQPSPSASHGFNSPPSGTGVGVHGLSHILRRRRSANGALNPNSVNASSMGANASPVDGVPPALADRPVTSSLARSHRIRLVPHLDSNRSLHFDPIQRDVREGDSPLRIGRFTDRSGMGVAALNAQNTNKLAFKSKVVSRAHAEVWCEPGGKFYIKDTKSSSGTFLNHIRLSAPNADSRSFPIKDGDVLQLGVDYQGGTEEIYKCVKMRIELGREWQTQANAFNTNALKQLRALSTQPSSDKPSSKSAVSKSGISDCCICLFSVTVHQSLFIAPCSHVFHYKCIRPMLNMHHPGFSCPLCRTFANLDEDVEIDLDEDTDNAEGTGGSGGEGTAPSGTNAQGQAMEVDVATHASTVLYTANEVAAQMHGGGGAETEVERDFAPTNYRRNGDVGSTLHGNHSPSPARNQFERVPEDADEYALAETEGEYADDDDLDERDDVHPLPGSIPGASPSTPSGSAGLEPPRRLNLVARAILRPRSVPIDIPHPRLELVGGYIDATDEGFAVVEGDASGSSGEGPLEAVDASGKRKR